jgi:hypothetical protein
VQSPLHSFIQSKINPPSDHEKESSKDEDSENVAVVSNVFEDNISPPPPSSLLAEYLSKFYLCALQNNHLAGLELKKICIRFFSFIFFT